MSPLQSTVRTGDIAPNRRNAIANESENTAMIFKPKALSLVSTLPMDELVQDKKNCRKIGPCGVGEKAIYLNSFYFDRRYYIPFSTITRVYKRVALSKGGFTGKGMFGSMPYLVVEYDDGQEKQCNFKYEEKVDQLVDYVGKKHPEIKLLSKKGEKIVRDKQRKLAEKKARIANAACQDQIQALDAAAAYLEQKSELGIEMNAAAKAKRVYDRSNPAYKWVALFIIIMAIAAAAFGVFTLVTKSGDNGLYFLLFGMAGIFLFAGSRVLPTAKNNRKAIEKRLADSVAATQEYVNAYGSEFPVPAHYAHAGVLRWMIEILADNRAQSIPQALKQLKIDLQKLNADVTVDQDDFDRIMAIKPLFVIRDYE